MNLFLLIGQSNMAGRGELIEQDNEADDTIVMLDAECKWVPARELGRRMAAEWLSLTDGGGTRV